MEWTRVETQRGISCRVLEGGEGQPLVFLHGAGGLMGMEPFLELLGAHFRVVAPELPGFGESTGEEQLEEMLDFTLHGWDMVDALGIDRPLLVGHSLGGMIAAEMACVSPERPDRLALVAPAGLWLDEHPIPDLFATLPHDLPELLFHDPNVGLEHLAGGRDFSDDDALYGFFVDNARRLATAGKLLFPIPNRKLSKRLYRLRSQTLLVWGRSDRLIPLVYAPRWQELIPGADLVTIEDAGHVVTHEQPEALAQALVGFLAN